MSQDPKEPKASRVRLTRRAFSKAAGMVGGIVASGAGSSVLSGVAQAATGTTSRHRPVSRGESAVPPGGPIMSGDRFPIGVFWPPPPYETTLARYQEIVEAGFTFSHSNNYLWADDWIQNHVLGIADQVGLDVLVDDPTVRWLLYEFDIDDEGGDFTVSTDEARKALQRALDRYRPYSYWKLVDGRMLLDGGTGNGSVGLSKEGTDWTDYTFRADVVPRQTGGGDTYAQVGLVFRARDEGSGYIWLLSNFPYTTPPALGYLSKAVFVDGDLASVESVPLDIAITAETTYRVEITVSGATLRTHIDGVDVDVTTDTTFARGRVGFRQAGRETGIVDNVEVEDASGNLLLTDDFSDGLAKWDPPMADGHPSFAGFDLYDEPGLGKLPTIGAAVRLLKELAPDTLPYVNLLPDFDGGDGYARAAEIVRPLSLSFDRYPILVEGEDAGYFRNWAQVRKAALDAGIPAWIFIQSLGMDGGKAVPTKADLLWQINVSLAYGCKGIQYFTYWTPDPARGGGYTGALLTADGKRTKLYHAAKDINNNYLSKVGKVLLPMRSETVQAANLADPPDGLPAFTADEYVQGTAGDPVVLGRFTKEDSPGTRWLLVANYSRRDSASVRLGPGTIVSRVRRYVAASDRWEPADRKDVRLRLAPGVAVLLALDAEA